MKLKSRWQSHESSVMPRPVGGNSTIQAISLLSKIIQKGNMNIIKTFYGQPSYTLENNKVSVQVTIQGGCLTASFRNDEEEKNPFFIAPWWNETLRPETAQILKVLRGSFFCLPFGDNSTNFKGVQFPPHGETANDNWDFVKIEEQSGEKRLLLKMELDKLGGEVYKKIKIRDDSSIVYIKNRVRGYSGLAPVGYHPTVTLPNTTGKAMLNFSDPVIGYTPRKSPEEPTNGGYSLLKPDVEITDATKVPCINGETADLTHVPITKGYDDVALFVNDQTRDFNYTSITYPDEGYLYFQIKNPKVLSNTFFWMSNGGRHYYPWNGRVNSTLGIEEVTSFFHYGIKQSIDSNFVQDNGHKTYLDFEKSAPKDIELIIGLIPVPDSFRGGKNRKKKKGYGFFKNLIYRHN